jgi:hypothetical protein
VQMPHLENETVLQPWEQDSLELVSWLEMLQFSASAFVYAGRALRSIKTECLTVAADCVDGEPVFRMTRLIDDEAKRRALASLSAIEPEFRKIGLAITADTINELIADLRDSELTHNAQWLSDRVDGIERLANKELSGKAFFYVPPERTKFWPTLKYPYAFGEKVASSFPSSTFDANNAGMCLAVMQSTASVFHLMRTLEIGLSALGNKFGVSLAHTNRAPAIEQIESKIRDIHKDPAWRALPDCKEQQEFYAQAASHFAILKDAWRNHAMHVRGKYTEEEAERIFENVKAFMQKLAERLKE